MLKFAMWTRFAGSLKERLYGYMIHISYGAKGEALDFNKKKSCIKLESKWKRKLFASWHPPYLYRSFPLPDLPQTEPNGNLCSNGGVKPLYS